MRVVIVYLLAIAGAEAITVFAHPMWGIVCHIAILVAAILQSSLAKGYHDSQRHLVLSLALVPLVRILSLSIPLVNIPQIWRYPAIYIPLAAAAFMVMRVLGYRTKDVGLNFRWSPVQLAVAVAGFGFGFAEYFILRPETVVTELVWQQVLPWVLIFVLFTGFVEELIFRGVLQRTAGEVFGGWRGIIYVSMLFAILHLAWYEANPSVSYWDVPFVFAVALFFGWVVKKTGSLIGVTLSHGITNTVFFLIAPFFF